LITLINKIIVISLKLNEEIIISNLYIVTATKKTKNSLNNLSFNWLLIKLITIPIKRNLALVDPK
jgi:hypothetical protein